MNTNEWPLVFFTVLSQAGAGMVIALLATTIFFRINSLTSSEELRRRIILTAAILTGIALMISFLHLAQPAHAVYALQGIESSWLSREIVMVSLFFALLATTWLIIRPSAVSQSLYTGLLMLLVTTGLLMIYTMIRLYMLPTIPVWNSASTPVAFLNTAHLLGPAFFLVAITLFSKPVTEPTSIKPFITMLTVVIVSGVLIHTVNTTLLIPKSIPAEAAFPPAAISVLWNVARWFFLFVGLAFMITWFAMFRGSNSLAHPWLLYAGAAGLLLAELIARYQFYASYYRIGI